MRKLCIITTGGTIEKTYDETAGILFNQGSVVQSLLTHLRLPDCKIQTVDLIAKDSLFMDKNDRAVIHNEIQKQASKKVPVVILHGTDTMELSAQHVYEHSKKLSAPVVFTGAMKPFGFVDSDALQNFTEALMASAILPPGVFIVFHGKVLPLPGVRKNHLKRTFEKYEDPASKRKKSKR